MPPKDCFPQTQMTHVNSQGGCSSQIEGVGQEYWRNSQRGCVEEDTLQNKEEEEISDIFSWLILDVAEGKTTGKTTQLV